MYIDKRRKSFNVCHRHQPTQHPTMPKLLERSRTWYMDETFHLVRKPFIKIFAINIFQRSDQCMEQVPAVIFVMSRRSSDDYKELFKIMKMVIGRHMAIENLMLDNKSAIWAAIRDVFPLARKAGYCFHIL